MYTYMYKYYIGTQYYIILCVHEKKKKAWKQSRKLVIL